MIAAIPIENRTMNSNISTKFARSMFYAIVNTNNNIIEFTKNNFVNEKTGVGKEIIKLLTNKYHVNSLIAFELGLKIQQIACEKKLQLIIVNKKNHTLDQLLKLMNV